MKKGKVLKIDYSSKRLAKAADDYYNRGKHISALRFAYRQYELYGGDFDVYERFADIYEAMGLHGSAINWLYRMLDIAVEEELPDIYESLAVNYLNLGNEKQSAYYYNLLLDVDDTLPPEAKMEIVSAFSKDKRDKFHFVYPPELADYSAELDAGARALKNGDVQGVIASLSEIPKGAKDYAHAMEMQAVAKLLSGDPKEAERICEELLQDDPNDVRVLATLSAVYLEQGRKEESHALAERLSKLPLTETEDLYKVATVCCENELHGQAYEKFVEICKRTPYDGRTTYFKAISALKSGKRKEGEAALDALCTVYPDAEVAKYYLRELRANEETIPETTYFYHLPQEEREARCKTLIHIGNAPKDEAQLFGLVALHDGYFRWCFDEMDGADHDLQYLGIITAAHVRADDFLSEVLLDSEVLDILKIETLRLLYTRNEDIEIGIVFCHTYRRVRLLPVKLGRKRRKRFVEGYAKVASKFALMNGKYAEKLRETTEKLYTTLERFDSLELVNSDDDCACAIFLYSGLKELGKDIEYIAKAFDANAERVKEILSITMIEEEVLQERKARENKNETTD